MKLNLFSWDCHGTFTNVSRLSHDSRAPFARQSRDMFSKLDRNSERKTHIDMYNILFMYFNTMYNFNYFDVMWITAQGPVSSFLKF